MPAYVVETWYRMSKTAQSETVDFMEYLLRKQQSEANTGDQSLELYEKGETDGFASLYRPLTENEMLIEIAEGIMDADSGRMISIEESKARHKEKYKL